MSTIYIQLKKNIVVQKNKPIKLADIAYTSSNERLSRSLDDLIIYKGKTIDQNELVIDGLSIIRAIRKQFPHVNIRLIGETYTIAKVKRQSRSISKLFIPLIWLILFIGTAMTIINFHHDVGMQDVHQKIHYMFTGKENDYPLWIQIPYSLGLGVGIILFFNYWFTKRFNKEPSPLEVELFKYEQDIAQYKHNEAIKNDHKSD